MKSTIYIALLDTSSIQQYIFGSNKLKENIGASYIVEEIYKEDSLKEIAKSLGLNYSDNHWKEKSESLSIIERNIDFEIAYIGGGSVLLLFKDENKESTKDLVKKYIQFWTKKLLLEAPGVYTSVAYEHYTDNLDDLKDKKKFIGFKKELYSLLKANQYKYSPTILLNHHGITSPCDRTDLTSESIYKYKDNNGKPKTEWISSVSFNKIDKNADNANDVLIQMLDSFQKDKFTFSLDIENIGQKENLFNYIAIIHIDGNGIGKKFEHADLVETRKLSINLDKTVRNAFQILIKEITKDFDKILSYLNISEKDYPKEYGKFILPIRPVLLGGDDITFISEGRLGIYFAQRFIELAMQETNKSENLIDFSLCAGVNIIKTKYPFYRGYQLCKELCDNAKKKRKEKPDSGSWIDFHIHQGRQTGSLEDIRDLHFKSSQGSLIKRPYKLNDKDVPEVSFDVLLENTKFLSIKENWPKNKVSELREVLWKDKASGDYFIQINKIADSKNRSLDLFHVDSSYKTQLFANSNTPYFDMIELLDFYPLEFKRGN